LAADQHRPNSWESYLSAHRGKLRDFEDHFILDNRLTFDLLPEGVWWGGTLVCQDGIEVHVERYQRSFFRKGSRWVETLFYKYEVIQRRAGRIIQVVRYDNVHAQRGHPDAHHRHVFDPDGGEIEPPEHLGSQRWPNLGQVLDEAHEYWCRQQASSR
jgi:hypothetical protein